MDARGGAGQAAPLRTIGLLGGMSDKATAEYYRRINAGVNARRGGWSTAEIIISSVDFAQIERVVRGDLWEEAGDYLAGKARGLERAGAEVLACVSNTMHRVSDAFTAGAAIPFIHIGDATGEAIVAAGLGKVGLLGTLPVMAGPTFTGHFSQRFGLDVLTPPAHEQVQVDRIIFDELVRGEVLEASRVRLLAIVDALAARGAEGVVLGCTEFTLIVEQADRPGLPMFDTTALHVEALCRFATSEAV